MDRIRIIGAVVAMGALAVGVAGPVGAQDDGMEAGDAIEIAGVEYAYVGLPTSVPSGTSLTLRNDGIELHELAIVRVGDEVTETLADLMTMGDAVFEQGLVEMVGEGPLVVMPGQTADGALALEQEGRYIAICFIPQGVIPEELAAVGVTDLSQEPDMESLSPEAQELVAEIMTNPPHAALGMVQEFTVTAEGTEVGPLPAMDDEAESMDDDESMDDPESEESDG